MNNINTLMKWDGIVEVHYESKSERSEQLGSGGPAKTLSNAFSLHCVTACLSLL